MKTYSLVITCLLFTSASIAQEAESSKERKTLYGFSVGWNQTNIKLNSEWQNGARSTSRGGFNLGIIADHKISELVSINPKIALSFHDSKILLTDIAAPNIVEVMPVLIDLHAHMNIHSNWGTLDPYLIVGPRYSLPIGQAESEFLDFDAPRDIGLDIGLGMSLMKEGIHFCPEVRYSVSGTSAVLSSLVPAAYRETLSVVLVFKG